MQGTQKSFVGCIFYVCLSRSIRTLLYYEALFGVTYRADRWRGSSGDQTGWKEVV